MLVKCILKILYLSWNISNYLSSTNSTACSNRNSRIQKKLLFFYLNIFCNKFVCSAINSLLCVQELRHRYRTAFPSILIDNDLKLNQSIKFHRFLVTTFGKKIDQVSPPHPGWEPLKLTFKSQWQMPESIWQRGSNEKSSCLSNNNNYNIFFTQANLTDQRFQSQDIFWSFDLYLMSRTQYYNILRLKSLFQFLIPWQCITFI